MHKVIHLIVIKSILIFLSILYISTPSLATEHTSIKYVRDLGVVQNININGAIIEYQISGDGEVIVVFESGFGRGYKVWTDVVKLLPNNIKRLTYSRSEVMPINHNIKPKLVNEHVNDLKVLLKKLKINKPVIYVAHSYGGLMAINFANRYPDALKGVILVDPATLSQRKQFKILDENMVKSEDELLNKVLPPHLKPTYNLLLKQMEYAPMQNLPLPKSLPAIIFTSTKPHSKPMVISETTKGKKVWMKLHQELISNRNIQLQRFIDSADHNLHLSEPQLIADAIMQMISN